MEIPNRIQSSDDVLKMFKTFSPDDAFAKKELLQQQSLGTLFYLSDKINKQLADEIELWRKSVDLFVELCKSTFPVLYHCLTTKGLLYSDTENTYTIDLRKNKIHSFIYQLRALIGTAPNLAIDKAMSRDMYTEYEYVSSLQENHKDFAERLMRSMENVLQESKSLYALKSMYASVAGEIDRRASEVQKIVELEVSKVLDKSLAYDDFISKLPRDIQIALHSLPPHDHGEHIDTSSLWKEEIKSLSANQLIWVRAMYQIPEMVNDRYAITPQRGGSNETIHGSLNHPVVSHTYGGWGSSDTYLIVPLQDLVEINLPPLSLSHIDTYWYKESLMLPQSSVMLVGANAQNEHRGISSNGGLSIIHYPGIDFDCRYRLIYAVMMKLGFTPLFGGMHSHTAVQKALSGLQERWHSYPAQHCDMGISQLESMAKEQKEMLIMEKV